MWVRKMEKIVFGNPIEFFSKELTDEDLNKVEKELNIKFPPPLYEFYKKINGGYPRKNCWKTENTIYIIGQILPIKYALSTSEVRLEDSYKILSKKNMLPEGFIPFAIDLGGNFFCINSKNEKIYWLDHEHTIQDGPDGQGILISENIKSFIKNLIYEEDL